MKKKATLTRETFRTSRLLEYFSEKELTLQTGHEPDRWPEVVLKELIDNALDACEEAGFLPEIALTVTENSIAVQDNGPGLPGSVIDSILDYQIRTSSKDAYVSPTRGAQGNALKTVVAIPYVLSGCERGEISITSQKQRHRIVVAVDRIAQEPKIQHVVEKDGLVKTGTRVTVDLARSEPDDQNARFLQLVEQYALFNPHASFTVKLGGRTHRLKRTVTSCPKWIAAEPTSPHWYTAEPLRALMAAYLAVERDSGRGRTVRDFVSEFRGLAGTAKQKAILNVAKVSGVHLRDLVHNGDVDRLAVRALLEAMQAESRPVKPAALGMLGEAHCRQWLERHELGVQTIHYKRIMNTDDSSGLPFVVEVAFAIRASHGGNAERRRLITGINFAPTLVDPFRALDDYGISLAGVLGDLHVQAWDPIIVVVHLTCPHLSYTDRGKSSLEAL